MKPSSFDQRLREALEARMGLAQSGQGDQAAQPGRHCLDAETLAAWADDSIDDRERALVEAHAADCPRCLALLTSMAKTAPETTALPSGARAWWRAPAIRWLAPLMAAAAAALVWAVVPPRMPPASIAPKPQDVQTPTPAAPSVGQVAQSLPPSDSPLRPSSPAPPRLLSRDGSRLQSKARATAAPSAALPAATAARPAPPAPSFERREAGAAKATNEATSRVTTPSGRLNAATETLSSADRAGSAAQEPPAVAGATAPLPPNPSAAGAQRQAVAPRAGRLLAQALRGPLPLEIASPDPSFLWRVASPGTVQRSVDGGMSWETQQTGSAAAPTAGASPSPTVCWLVGPGGMVLQTRDGRTWRQVPFPVTVDLTGVRASDEKTATIISADGRTFSTSDGGLTWSPQENLPAPF